MAVSLASQTTGSSASSANATATVPATAVGNLLVAFYARSGGLGTGAVTGVTDSAGQTWTLATRGAVSGGANTRLECWYVANSASVTSVTFTSGTAQVNAWNVLEFTGAAAVSPLDVASPDNSAAAASTSIATPSITTTVDGDLVLAAIHYTQTTGVLATAGFTALTDYDYSTTGSGRAAYRAGSPVGGYSATWTLGAAQAAGVITVAFKAAAGASVAPDGVSVPVALGSPTADVSLTAAPDGISVPVALGVPGVAMSTPVFPDGLPVPVVLGTPAVSWSATVAPGGLSVPVQLGSPDASQPGNLVTRPNTGTVTRPTAGTVTRPDTGVVVHILTVVVRLYTGTVSRP